MEFKVPGSGLFRKIISYANMPAIYFIGLSMNKFRSIAFMVTWI